MPSVFPPQAGVDLPPRAAPAFYRAAANPVYPVFAAPDRQADSGDRPPQKPDHASRGRPLVYFVTLENRCVGGELTAPGETVGGLARMRQDLAPLE
jgi:hypothetical protein